MTARGLTAKKWTGDDLEPARVWIERTDLAAAEAIDAAAGVSYGRAA